MHVKILNSWQARISVFALALAAAVVLTVLVVRSQGASSQHAVRTNNMLLSGNRDRLRICIQAPSMAPGDISSAVVEVNAALRLLTSHPNWKPAGLAVAPPAVEGDFRAKPYALQPGVTIIGGKTDYTNAARVTEPSPYRVMVFVLPDDLLASKFPGSAKRTVAQELSCQEGVCSEVTTGLYLGMSELVSAEFLRSWLTVAIGLEPYMPPTSPGASPDAKE